ncbi:MULTISPECIES: hypothetical protein [unclassified Dehalobacter]|uniref:hypothetical protein n=1 Tax=unclassified Dehalobacter TaxID=2635733 RepID=UPI000E6B9099|nr:MULTISPECIES: hypothetical protein [unclassified Dehalobacter]RJE49178.1 hypothetical protein A7K50_06565 [Dehalobacter sp. MCB1]TCX53218.1 hypothetical protein C1I36_00195 [Dehalobacter sp. 14DCB1]TCX54232.1 hypothetical protein C1I38_05580 [Dehalobacter sp. 12DCB1]
MKKKIIWVSIAAVLLIFSCVACAKSSSGLPAKQAADSQAANSGQTGTSKEINPSSTKQSLDGTNSGVSVISKSDNVYTDAQKQQTLNELSGEIDKLIESINNLDEAQDSELTFDQ